MSRADGSSTLAEAVLRFRRARLDALPGGLFGEAGWDMMLALFVADAHGRRVTGRMVADRCRVAPSSASRWLRYLSDEGLVIGDGEGNLEDGLTLSGKGLASMEALLEVAQELRDHLAGS